MKQRNLQSLEKSWHVKHDLKPRDGKQKQVTWRSTLEVNVCMYACNPAAQVNMKKWMCKQLTIVTDVQGTDVLHSGSLLTNQSSNGGSTKLANNHKTRENTVNENIKKFVSRIGFEVTMLPGQPMAMSLTSLLLKSRSKPKSFSLVWRLSRRALKQMTKRGGKQNLNNMPI